MYGVFSIFLRSAFDSDEGKDISKPANLLENMYLIVLFMILLASIGIHVNLSKSYFSTAITILGIFFIMVLVASFQTINQSEIGLSI